MTAGADCVPLERLVAAQLTEPDARHLDSCARCQTERALAQAFDAVDPMPDEGAAVAWIVNETRRRVFPDSAPVAPARSGARWFGLPRWSTWAGAALAASLGVYLLVQAPATPVQVEPGPEYRSVAVAPLAPVGDVGAVPTELRWQALPGAVDYAVSVREVDGTEVWTGSTRDTGIALPEEVRAAARPARTLMWRIEAMDAAGRPVGEAATATFRVLP